jgi:hypothetical protein
LDYTLLDSLGLVLYRLGQVGCYALSVYAIAYVVRNRRSFTLSSAIVYLISVCFFLPDYLTLLIPDITPANSAVSLLNFSIVHGSQYLIFLLAHAVGCTRIAYEAEKPKGFGLEMVIAVIIPATAFLFIAVVLGSFLNVSPLFITLVVSLGAKALGSGPLDIGVIAAGFAMGLSTAHFWLDQFFWKLSNPVQREWIFSRFQWVLAK